MSRYDLSTYMSALPQGPDKCTNRTIMPFRSNANQASRKLSQSYGVGI